MISGVTSMSRCSKYKKAKSIIEQISNEEYRYVIIHYSCESFFNIKDGKTPRITSIAVKELETGQVKSFSIHQCAEFEHIELNEICNKYDELERKMLQQFFDYAEQINNNRKIWLHWNMRDSNYGFEALKNRFNVLTGIIHNISFQNIDLSALLINYYGVQYIGQPRLEKIMEKNGFSKGSFLKGKEEAIAFDQKEYVKLHQSTLKKVDVIFCILDKVMDNSLKTNTTLKSRYGFSIQCYYEVLQSKWWWKLFVTLFLLIAGGIIGHFIEGIFSKE